MLATAVVSVAVRVLAAAAVLGSAQELEPDAYRDSTQLITSKGYPCENHWVTTKDGFILNMQRIPHGVKPDPKPGSEKPVVVLQHGHQGSSSNWLENLANESLAYILADAGADVWLPNSRGNFYSTNHTRLHRNQKEFWAWSWDEMVLYDLPATLDYVTNHANVTQVHYMGHSQGTVIGFAGFSTNHTLAAMVKRFYAFAPVTKLHHTTSVLALLAPIAKEALAFYEMFGFYDILDVKKDTLDFFARYVCRDVSDMLCENVFFLLGGFDKTHFNESRIPVYVAHNPAGSSAQTLLHYAQGCNVDAFQMFDYGSSKANMDHYNQTTPPAYDLSKFKTPTVLYTGGHDAFADPKDVAWTAEQIGDSLLEKVLVEDYEHFDYLWAEDAAKIIYPDVLSWVFSNKTETHK